MAFSTSGWRMKLGTIALSACAAKQVAPMQKYTLGMGRAEYRDYGGARALCEAEPRWLADELSSVNGLLARFLSSTEQAGDPAIAKLLNDLAEAEKDHTSLADRLGLKHLTPDAKLEEAEAKKKLFLLQVIQPGLVGLMDGSVSTLAPLFAAALLIFSPCSSVPITKRTSRPARR